MNFTTLEMSSKWIGLISLVVAFLFSSTSAVADTMAKADLVGCWKRVAGVALGEGDQTVCFDEAFTSTWTTHSSDSPQVLETTSARFVDDFAILSTADGTVKMTLAGWKHEDGTSALFGTLYLYGSYGREDGLYNGLFFILDRQGKDDIPDE